MARQRPSDCGVRLGAAGGQRGPLRCDEPVERLRRNPAPGRLEPGLRTAKQGQTGKALPETVQLGGLLGEPPGRMVPVEPFPGRVEADLPGPDLRFGPLRAPPTSPARGPAAPLRATRAAPSVARWVRKVATRPSAARRARRTVASDAPRRASISRTRSSRRGRMSRAAAEGVLARTSAARSRSGRFASWPIALTSGTGQAAAARTTSSSLKGRRSSTEPPPRATTMTSRSQAAQRPNPGGQRSRRPGPLHRCVLFADPDAGEPPAGRSREIDRRVAPGGGQETDPEREKGERALPRRIEQPLAFESRLPFLELLQQRADPGLLEALDLELVDALAVVGAQPAEGADPVPRLGNEGEAPGVAGPGHGLEDHPLLAEGQVEVAALRPAHLGEFPLDPQAPWEAVLQHLPDAGTDLPDRERGRGRPRTGGGSRLDPGLRRRRRDRRRR